MLKNRNDPPERVVFYGRGATPGVTANELRLVPASGSGHHRSRLTAERGGLEPQSSS